MVQSGIGARQHLRELFQTAFLLASGWSMATRCGSIISEIFILYGATRLQVYRLSGCAIAKD